MRLGVDEVRIEGSVLEELYARHATAALRLAYLLTGDRSLADDVVQDAFVRLAGRLLHVRDPGGFHAYLRVTVVNLVRAHSRRARIEHRFLERRTVEAVAVLPDVTQRESLRVALMALPVRQRTALILRFFEDLSEAETAALMRCRPGTVKSLVSRGKEALRSVIGDE
jgi:RNA polymerase sigma factor (sigma-70 family)